MKVYVNERVAFKIAQNVKSYRLAFLILPANQNQLYIMSKWYYTTKNGIMEFELHKWIWIQENEHDRKRKLL